MISTDINKLKFSKIIIKLSFMVAFIFLLTFPIFTSSAAVTNVSITLSNPLCSDGIQNQDESDIDCGGTKCGACENGKSCSQNSDCQSNYCNNGTCETESDGGGGGGGSGSDSYQYDQTAPKISDINTSEPTISSVKITWELSEPSACLVKYGLTENYTKNVTLGYSASLVRSVVLTELGSDTFYHFMISCNDVAGNVGSSKNKNFYTLAPPDNEAPPNVSFLRAVSGNGKIILYWEKPVDDDFYGVRIHRNEIGYPLSINDGEMIFQGKATKFTDKGLTNGVFYYYTVFSYDKVSNYSSGAIAFAQPKAEEKEEPEPPVEPPPPIEPEEEPEIDFPFVVEVDDEEVKEILDVKAHEEDICCFLEILLDQDLKQIAIKDIPLTFSLPHDEIKEYGDIIKNITIKISDDEKEETFLLGYDQESEIYKTKITAPETGEYEVEIKIDYQDGPTVKLKSKLTTIPKGNIITLKPQAGKVKVKRLMHAKIILYNFNEEAKKWELWPGEKYGQSNPQTANIDGQFGFTVPNGHYYVVAYKEGYYPRGREIKVENNSINPIMVLKETPKPIWQKMLLSVKETIAKTKQEAEKTKDFVVYNYQYILIFLLAIIIGLIILPLLGF